MVGASSSDALRIVVHLDVQLPADAAITVVAPPALGESGFAFTCSLLPTEMQTKEMQTKHTTEANGAEALPEGAQGGSSFALDVVRVDERADDAGAGRSGAEGGGGWGHPLRGVGRAVAGPIGVAEGALREGYRGAGEGVGQGECSLQGPAARAAAIPAAMRMGGRGRTSGSSPRQWRPAAVLLRHRS